VCIEPYQEMVDLRVKEWASKFQKLQGGKEIVSVTVTGETSADLRLLEKGDVIICNLNPCQPEPVSGMSQYLFLTLITEC
jgi:hypothetical protein